MLIPLILGGLAVAAIVMASQKPKSGNVAWQILIQTPAPIPASEAMIATALGIAPSDLIGMSSPAQGQLIVRARFSSPPTPGKTINFFGVPGTIVQVLPIPGGGYES